ncbi:MAG: hypothetical protein ACFFC7_21375 [Candidatus Hermodarchaeota archaeon]
MRLLKEKNIEMTPNVEKKLKEYSRQLQDALNENNIPQNRQEEIFNDLDELIRDYFEEEHVQVITEAQFQKLVDFLGSPREFVNKEKPFLEKNLRKNHRTPKWTETHFLSVSLIIPVCMMIIGIIGMINILFPFNLVYAVGLIVVIIFSLYGPYYVMSRKKANMSDFFIGGILYNIAGSICFIHFLYYFYPLSTFTIPELTVTLILVAATIVLPFIIFLLYYSTIDLNNKESLQTMNVPQKYQISITILGPLLFLEFLGGSIGTLYPWIAQFLGLGLALTILLIGMIGVSAVLPFLWRSVKEGLTKKDDKYVSKRSERNYIQWIKRHTLFLSILLPSYIVLFLNAFLAPLAFWEDLDFPKDLTWVLNPLNPLGAGSIFWLGSIFIIGLFSFFIAYYVFSQEKSKLSDLVLSGELYVMLGVNLLITLSIAQEYMVGSLEFFFILFSPVFLILTYDVLRNPRREGLQHTNLSRRTQRIVTLFGCSLFIESGVFLFYRFTNMLDNNSYLVFMNTFGVVIILTTILMGFSYILFSLYDYKKNEAKLSVTP